MRSTITALVFGCLLVPDASACSCAPITLQNAAKSADSVLLATLQEARLLPGGSHDQALIEGKFLVYKTLKGSPPAGLIILRTPRDDSSCGVKMMVAAKYVIFKKSGSDAIIACDGSAVIEHFGPVSQWEENEVTDEVQKAAPKKPRQR